MVCGLLEVMVVLAPSSTRPEAGTAVGFTKSGPAEATQRHMAGAGGRQA